MDNAGYSELLIYLPGRVFHSGVDLSLSGSFEEKLERGDEDVVEIGSQADHKKQIDPKLAQRWAALASLGNCFTIFPCYVARRSCKLAKFQSVW